MKSAPELEDIPKMSKEDRKNVILGLVLGNSYGPVWHLEAKFGKEAAAEYLAANAKALASAFRENGYATPREVAMFFAGPEKHLLGSELELLASDTRAVLVFHHCNRLEYALKWAGYGKGREREITRESYCRMCLDGNLALIAKDMGFEFEREFFEGGCRLTMSKKED